MFLLFELLVRTSLLMVFGVKRSGCILLLCEGANLIVGDEIVVSPSSATVQM